MRERIAGWKLSVSRQQQQQPIVRAAKFIALLLQDVSRLVKPFRMPELKTEALQLVRYRGGPLLVKQLLRRIR